MHVQESFLQLEQKFSLIFLIFCSKVDKNMKGHRKMVIVLLTVLRVFPIEKERFPVRFVKAGVLGKFLS